MPAEAAELLERHLPVLRYDSQGSFFADSAATLPERRSDDGRSVNLLKRGDGGIVAKAGGKLTLDFLGATKYANGRKVEGGDFLDAVGRDYVLDARALHAKPEYADRAYGHVAEGADGRRWLQYWLFYYWNNKSFLGFGLHEGDWEMVQVAVDGNDRPHAMTFAQHDHGERIGWADVERRGPRPVVYVSRGSQASYPRPGRHRAPIVSDVADGQGAEVTPKLEVLTDRTPGWVSWGGRWGSSRARNIAESNSPRGPKQHEQWQRPDEFHEDSIDRRRLQGIVLGAPELRVAPAPRITVRRVEDRAVVKYTFRRPKRGEAPPVQLVVSVDSPGDTLPPATYAFAVEGLRGEVEHPLPLGDARYVVRASASTREGVTSDTVEKRLPKEGR
jgi:hypothetical protein